MHSVNFYCSLRLSTCPPTARFIARTLQIILLPSDYLVDCKSATTSSFCVLQYIYYVHNVEWFEKVPRAVHVQGREALTTAVVAAAAAAVEAEAFVVVHHSRSAICGSLKVVETTRLGPTTYYYYY